MAKFTAQELRWLALGKTRDKALRKYALKLKGKRGSARGRRAAKSTKTIRTVARAARKAKTAKAEPSTAADAGISLG